MCMGEMRFLLKPLLACLSLTNHLRRSPPASEPKVLEFHSQHDLKDAVYLGSQTSRRSFFYLSNGKGKYKVVIVGTGGFRSRHGPEVPREKGANATMIPASGCVRRLGQEDEPFPDACTRVPVGEGGHPPEDAECLAYRSPFSLHGDYLDGLKQAGFNNDGGEDGSSK